MVQFTHLHTHTPEGSLLDGFMRIGKAIDKAKSLGMDSLGVSDHGTMAAHKKFYDACKAADIHPVLGMEAYITTNKTYKKADFQQVVYITDDDDNYIFSFLTEDELEESDNTWVKLEDITPKKLQNGILNEAKEPGGPLWEMIRETLPNKTMPEKKAQVTRLVNAYIKEAKISGKELYLEGDASRRDYYEWFPTIGHLLLIAKNNEGYQNLIRLQNIGQLEGFYGKPRIDFDDIETYGKGIVATTACLGSMTSKLIMQGRLEEAKAEIQRLVDAFDEVFLEIQPSRQADQQVVNNQLIAWSDELGLPLIATTDAHMVDKDEEELHKSITNIGKGSSSDTSEYDEDISVYDSAYLMSPEQVLEFGIPEIALQNAYDLAHRCQVDFLESNELKFPKYDVVEGHTFDTYLRELAENGLFEIFMKKTYIEDYQVYQDRLDYELGIIKDKGLSAYFIIVWDYINFAKSKDIFIGAGRGSAAGSLVSYTLGITNLDPIKYDLLFERFLNPERASLPDVDSDFDYYRREEVIQYLKDKYGEHHVAKIGTYGTNKAKSILKDVGRLMGFDHDTINKWNKELPSFNGETMKLEDAINIIPTFIKANSQHPDLFDLAIDLEGMPKSAGQHPCGIQITSEPLYDMIPLMRSKDKKGVTEYEGGPLEDLGFIKFDILGIKYLSVLRIASELVQSRHGIDLDLNNIEPEDQSTFDLVGRGETFGIFQMSSSGMQELFRGIETIDFESMIAGVALYRPGPMEHIPDYQDRANGLKPVSYPHPALENILSNTYGIAIYQEQIMEMTKRLGGYSAGQADKFRKAIGKKSKKVMDEELPKLEKAITDNGYPEEIANHTIELIKPFIGYGFNRSHAAAYAFLAYQTAFLKANYTIEFFTALLTVFSDDKEKVAGFIQDARQYGITILPPDVNASEEDFAIVDEHSIRFGFNAIKGLPEKAVHTIPETRPYTALHDLINNNEKSQVNKTAVDRLVWSGAMDKLGEGLSRLDILKRLYYFRGDGAKVNDLPEELSHREILDQEKATLGIYLSGHPLDDIARPIDWESADDGTVIEGLAMLDRYQKITTKKGDPMSFATFEFVERQVEGVIFPHVFSREKDFRKGDKLVPIGELMEVGMVVKVRGQYEEDRRGEMSFIVRDINLPVRANEAFHDRIREIQDEKGVEPEVPEAIDVPQFDIPNFY